MTVISCLNLQVAKLRQVGNINVPSSEEKWQSFFYHSKSFASLWPRGRACWYGMEDGKMVFYLKLQETCSVRPISW